MWARGTLLALGSDACISQRGPASGSSEASSKSSLASTLLFQDGGDWIVGVLPSEVTLRVHQGRARNAVSRGPGGEPALVKQAALTAASPPAPPSRLGPLLSSLSPCPHADFDTCYVLGKKIILIFRQLSQMIKKR